MRILVKRHAVDIAVIGIILRHLSAVIGIIHRKMTAHLHIAELLGTQQHFLHLVRHHGRCLRLQFLHGVGNPHCGIFIPAGKQQITVLIHYGNVCRGLISQSCGSRLCHGRRVGRSKILCHSHLYVCEVLRVHIAESAGTGLPVKSDGDVLYGHSLGKHILQFHLPENRILILPVSGCGGHAHLHHVAVLEAAGHVPLRSNGHIGLRQLVFKHINGTCVRALLVSDAGIIQNLYNLCRGSAVFISIKSHILRP